MTEVPEVLQPPISLRGTRMPGTRCRSATTRMDLGRSGQASSHRPQPVQEALLTTGRPPTIMMAASGNGQALKHASQV